MFAALGRGVHRWRRAVVVVTVVIAALVGILAWDVGGALGPGSWIDPDSESWAVSERLGSEFGSGGTQVIVVYSGAPGVDARAGAFQDGVRVSLAGLLADPLVVGVTGYREIPDDRFIARDGNGTFVVVRLDMEPEAAQDEVPRLRSLIRPVEGVSIALTGFAPIAYDLNRVSERDLARAELVSLPLALAILVAVFASLMAAGMPLLVAGLAIPTTLGLISLLARSTEMSVYALNVATMLGLALAIDYSLFLVSRFREELAAGRSTADAVERTVATAGKAVAFSALAVAVGLSGLLLFKASALTSMGVAGVLVVAVSAACALTFLPAVLGMLGPRINALSVAGLYRRLGLGRLGLADRVMGEPSPWWGRVAAWVMAHPVRVLVPTLAFLLILGLPFLQIRQTVPDSAVFPAGVESRAGIVALEREYAEGAINPLIVLADVEGDALAPDTIRALAGFSAALAAVPGVARVEGPFSGLANPLTGELLTTEQLVVAYSDPTFRPVLQPLLDRYVRASTVRIDGVTALPVASPQTEALVAAIRSLDPGPGIRVSLGGTHAGSTDFLDATGQRAPYMVVTVVLGMLVALFLLFGSIVLPIKAVLMTLLSIAASFGALVWIFQQGHLSDVLGFEPPGYTVAGTPIVMFAILVGLSMDYEVLLLSRIAEAWRRTRDNTRSVAEGLSRTAGVITGAALIMVVVFASFALADTLTIKALGLGMAIAVLLDATVVRILLVPATMRLVGDWNWWAPGPLRRIADRIGFDRPETDEEADGPVGSGDPGWAGDAPGTPAPPASDVPRPRP